MAFDITCNMKKIIIIILLFLCFITCNKNKDREKANHKSTENEYIVTATSLNIRSKPDVKSDKIGVLEKGEIVTIFEWTGEADTIEDQTALWVKIISQEGTTGYIFGAFIEYQLSDENRPQEWTENIFYGNRNGLAVPEDKKLLKNDGILYLFWNFNNNINSEIHIIDYVIPLEFGCRIFKNRGFSKVYRNKKLCKIIGPCWSFRADTTKTSEIAIISTGSRDTIGIGIRNLPYEAIVLSAPRQVLNGDALESYSQIASINKSENTLLKGLQYGTNQFHSLVEFFVGVPKYSDSSEMQSIKINKYIIYNDKILEQYTISRDRDKQEHVDTAPPDLNEDNWYNLPKKTLGFISTDSAKTWNIVYIDIGFEGIGYYIKKTGAGEFIFKEGLYTLH